MIREDEIRYYKQLDERQGRLFLGMKAQLLGRSGVRIVSEDFGVNIRANQNFQNFRIHRQSVYAKQEVELKKLSLHPEWLTAFDKILEGSTTGLPQNENVKWTHLSITRIKSQLSDSGFSISRYHIKQMLQLRGYKKRKFIKMNDLSNAEQRNEQFEKIMLYRKQFSDREEMFTPIVGYIANRLVYVFE